MSESFMSDVAAELNALGLVNASDLLLFGDGDQSGHALVLHGDQHDAADPARAAVHANVAGRRYRIEYRHRSAVDALVRKLEGNIRSIPALSLLLKASHALGAGAFEPDLDGVVDSGHCRLSPVEPSGPLTSYFAEILSKDSLRRRRREGGLKVDAKVLEDSEFQLLERLVNWPVAQGAAKLREVLLRMHAVCTSLQLTLIHMICLQRTLEDVNGMVGIRSASAVLLAARASFLQLARAHASVRGTQIGGEVELLAWTQRSGDTRLYDVFCRGLFPDPLRADEHLGWLRGVIRAFSDDLNRNWMLKLALRHITSIVKSDTSDSQRPNIRDADYHAPPPITDGAGIRAALSAYGLDPAGLLALVPGLCEADSVLLVGSVADGLGHERSDIDMIVLTEAPRELVVNTVSLWEGQQECYCGVTAGGHSICASFMTRDLLHRMDRWVLELAVMIENGHIESADRDTLMKARNHPWARLWYRARTGVVMKAGLLSARWQPTIPLSSFNAVMACSHMLAFDDLMAGCSASVSPTARIVGSRAAFEHILYAVLANDGKFYWTKRWIPEGIFRRGDADDVAAARSGLFPQPDDVAYPSWVRHQGDRIKHKLCGGNPLLAPWLEVGANAVEYET